MMLVGELSPRSADLSTISSPASKHRRLLLHSPPMSPCRAERRASLSLSHSSPASSPRFSLRSCSGDCSASASAPGVSALPFSLSSVALSSPRVCATSPQLHDVWVNVIGPKLHAEDIVVLSSVSKWGHHIAHSIMHHEGCLKWTPNHSLAVLEHASRVWSHLRLQVEVWEDAMPLSAESLTQLSLTHPHLLSGGACGIAQLRLVWCPLKNFDFVDASRLEQFHRVGPRICRDTLQSLERMLLKCTSLVSLTLSNSIDETDDVKWLGRALKGLTKLTHLDMRCNYLEADRAQELAPALAQMTQMTSLDLSVNALGPEGMQHIAPSLAKMTKMKELILQYNRMGAEGAKSLVPALGEMRDLTGLYLGENGMGPDGVKSLLPVLPLLRHLKHANIEVKSLGAEARPDVRKLVPQVNDVDLW